jgi:hypothetical protein
MENGCKTDLSVCVCLMFAVIMDVKAELVDQPDEDEEAILEVFNSFSAIQQKNIFGRLAKRLEPDAKAICITKGCIKVPFFCTSVSVLQCLYDLYVNDHLRTILEDIFVFLLNRCQIIPIRIIWNDADYNRCVQYLSESTVSY